MHEGNFPSEGGYDTHQQSVDNLGKSLSALIARHALEYESLETEQAQELNACTVSFEAKLEELAETHNYAVQMMITDQERELKAMREIQEKEIQFEETMHDNEMKMLIERRILNSVLYTVSDGIICISPAGIIMRFNHAAEKLFGYTAEEVMGKNIKMLVPQEHARNHDQYLKNYLSTGIKKVLGIGRRVKGLTKEGTLFPFHLSLSEVKEHGEHMFTGIVHDLTQEARLINLGDGRGRTKS
jgi:PAS domain S-box-containing protein